MTNVAPTAIVGLVERKWRVPNHESRILESSNRARPTGRPEGLRYVRNTARAPNKRSERLLNGRGAFDNALFNEYIVAPVDRWAEGRTVDGSAEAAASERSESSRR